MAEIIATVTEVLAYYDEPICVAANTGDGQTVIGLLVDEREDGTRLWLGARVSDETFNAALNNKLEWRAPFTTHRIGAALAAEDVEGVGCVVTWTEMTAEPADECLPYAGVFWRLDQGGDAA
jgi:hypothetical protein